MERMESLLAEVCPYYIALPTEQKMQYLDLHISAIAPRATLVPISSPSRSTSRLVRSRAWLITSAITNTNYPRSSADSWKLSREPKYRSASTGKFFRALRRARFIQQFNCTFRSAASKRAKQASHRMQAGYQRHSFAWVGASRHLPPFDCRYTGHDNIDAMSAL